MADYTKIAIGQVCFFLGLLALIVLDLTMPVVIEVLSTVFNNTTFDQIAWLPIVIAYIILLLVLPTYYIIEGLRTPGDHNGILGLGISIIIFLFSILLTLKGWFIIEAMAGFATNTLMLTAYWISFAWIWILAVIIPVIYNIIKLKQ